MYKALLGRPRLMRSIFRVNMAIGLIAFAAAFYFTITGQYDNLASRVAAEAVLNRIAIGSLLYGATFWFVDVFSRPFLTVSEDHRA